LLLFKLNTTTVVLLDPGLLFLLHIPALNMKLPPTSGPLFRGKSRRFKWSTTIIVLIVVIVIAVVVPLAVVLPRKSAATKGLKSIVLVPLYIYPASGAWDPLYDV
jgi:hypothetical protein